MAERYDDLLVYIHNCLDAALDATRDEDYNDLMPALDLPGDRLKKYIGRNLLQNLDAAVASELKAYNIRAKLVELATAEERARARQQRWLESPALVPREEQPVVLPRLSTRDLVDCQLRDARQAWLAELQTRLRDARRAAGDARASVEQQTAAVETRLARIQQQLRELERARAALVVAPRPE